MQNTFYNCILFIGPNLSGFLFTEINIIVNGPVLLKLNYSKEIKDNNPSMIINRKLNMYSAIISLSMVNIVAAASLQDQFYSTLRNLAGELTTEASANDKAEFYEKGCETSS